MTTYQYLTVTMPPAESQHVRSHKHHCVAGHNCELPVATLAAETRFLLIAHLLS